ncbi:hypothetical protein BLNAU_3741 [Blattamonas nauphoetae]|uniref:Uncharacterized protein n=1 Tax=Blattamonas nauphoetae TaxID=2049346 RepID=A0ABQ9YC75_9EUKA|nr:hypothetical protein BLNAU_3741 [Blattamonas nauphoetae]
MCLLAVASFICFQYRNDPLNLLISLVGIYSVNIGSAVSFLLFAVLCFYVSIWELVHIITVGRFTDPKPKVHIAFKIVCIIIKVAAGVLAFFARNMISETPTEYSRMESKDFSQNETDNVYSTSV